MLFDNGGINCLLDQNPLSAFRRLTVFETTEMKMDIRHCVAGLIISGNDLKTQVKKREVLSCNQALLQRNY